MKTYKLLYYLLIENFIKSEDEFICHSIETLVANKVFSLEEEEKLRSHFDKQYPTKRKHKEFFAKETFLKLEDGHEYHRGRAWFYWQDKESRIDLLNKIYKSI